MRLEKLQAVTDSARFGQLFCFSVGRAGVGSRSKAFAERDFRRTFRKPCNGRAPACGILHKDMSAIDDSSTQRLLDALSQDGEESVNLLFERCRPRLRSLVALRLDTRLQARVDPSDVVQETLIQAHKKLPEYLAQNPLPLPFYAWLRQIAIERIIDHHRRHLHAQARSVKREQRLDGWLPDHSTQQLANHLVASGIRPEFRLSQHELKVKVKAAIAKLPEP